MKAFLSGQAGLAVVTGKNAQVRRLCAPAHNARHESEALRALDGCPDVRVLQVETLEELDLAIENAWAVDRGLRLFLLLLDPEEPEEELSEYAACVQELLDHHNVGDQIEGHLFSCGLPITPNLEAIVSACKSFEDLSSRLQRLIGLQDEICRVRRAYDEISLSMFRDGRAKDDLFWKLVLDGSFRAIALALKENQNLNFLKLEVSARNIDQSPAISLWFAKLQPALKRLPRSLLAAVDSTDELDGESDEGERSSSDGAFDRVRSQKHFIGAKLREHDVYSARRLMEQLIASQRSNSTAEQIGKTLCSMAQQAKLCDLPELQLEWARWATEESPQDPRTFGHLADALIGLSDFAAATAALDQAAARGESAYAAGGRARILRLTDRPAQARAAFLDVLKAYPHSEDAQYALVGAAECLRDLGELERAVEEFKKITADDPLNAMAWSGLAYTLMDLGKFSDAIQNFGRAAVNDRSTGAKIGRANAFRLKGAFDEALAIYSEVIDQFPRSHLAWCGQAETYRSQGRLSEALVSFDEAISRSPYSPVAWFGKANLLREMDRFTQALELLDEGAAKFPYSRRLKIGRADVLLSRGDFREALALYETFYAEYPFDVYLACSRAVCLRRLGSFEAALAVYDEVLGKLPGLGRARLGKASLLLNLGNYSHASAILKQERPQSQSDWREYLLRGMLLERLSSFAAGAQLLEHGVRHCPFAHIRRNFRNALTALELRRNRRDRAQHLVDEAPEEVSPVIALHTLAVNGRPELARERLERIRKTEGPAILIDLAEEIAARHQLGARRQLQPTGWLWRTERNLILDEAA